MNDNLNVLTDSMTITTSRSGAEDRNNNNESTMDRCLSQDSDATDAFINSLDQDILANTHRSCSSTRMLDNKIHPRSTGGNGGGNSSNISANIYQSQYQASQPVLPSVESPSECINIQFVQLIKSRLPRVIASEQSTTQSFKLDNSPGAGSGTFNSLNFTDHLSLSQSFQNCFNIPVFDLLIVVLNSSSVVCFYQGFFAGLPHLSKELINLNGKQWKKLISNNDEHAWDNHSKHAFESYCASIKNGNNNGTAVTMEGGPVMRCRLRNSNGSNNNSASLQQSQSQHQHNQNHNHNSITCSQQFSYFFIKPCSFVMRLSMTDNPENLYLVSYINVVRECETEFALKGSAAASLQKVITNNSVTRVTVPSNNTASSSPSSPPTINRQTKRRTSSNNVISTPSTPPMFPRPPLQLATATSDTNSVVTSSPNLQYILEHHQNSSASAYTRQHPQQQPSHPHHPHQRVFTTVGTTGAPVQNFYRGVSGYHHSHHPQMNNSAVYYHSTTQPLQQQSQSQHMTVISASHPNNAIYTTPLHINTHYQYQNVPNSTTATLLMTTHQQQPQARLAAQYHHHQHHQQTHQQTHPQSHPQSHQTTPHSYPVAIMHQNTSNNISEGKSISQQISQNCWYQPPIPLLDKMSTQPNINGYVESNSGSGPVLNQMESNNQDESKNRTPSVDVYGDVIGEGPTSIVGTSLDENTISFDIVEEILRAEEAKCSSTEENGNNHFQCDQQENNLCTPNSLPNFMIGDDEPPAADLLNEFGSLIDGVGSNSGTDNRASSTESMNPTFGVIEELPLSTPPAVSLQDKVINDKLNNSSENHNISTVLTMNASFSEPNTTVSNSEGSTIVNNSKTFESHRKHPLFNLKKETLARLSKEQREQIKTFVKDYGDGYLNKEDMYFKILKFLTDALGSETFTEQVREFWESQHKHQKNKETKLTKDSKVTSIGYCYSHVIQSPEEGPGISPTEQAAQSTTVDNFDESLPSATTNSLRYHRRQRSGDTDQDNVVRYRHHSHGNVPNTGSSLPSSTVTGTASTNSSNVSSSNSGVLEKLLNDNDYVYSGTSKRIPNDLNSINLTPLGINNSNFNQQQHQQHKFGSSSSSSTPGGISNTYKNNLSLDQLLLDDDNSPFQNYTSCQQLQQSSVSPDDSKSQLKQHSRKRPNSQQKPNPSTISECGTNMGVLESLLNQKPTLSNNGNNGTSSTDGVRQRSLTTGVIMENKSRTGGNYLRHNSVDASNTQINSVSTDNQSATGQQTSPLNSSETKARKNSLLIHLLNNPSSLNRIGDNSILAQNINPGPGSNFGSSEELTGAPLIGSKQRRLSTSTKNGIEKQHKRLNDSPSNSLNSSGLVDVFDFVNHELQQQQQLGNNNNNNNNNNSTLLSTPTNASVNDTSTNNTKGRRGRKRCKTEMMVQTPQLHQQQNHQNPSVGSDILTTLLGTPATTVSITSASTVSTAISTAIEPPPMNIDDIKIDDFDVDSIMEMAEDLPSVNSVVPDPPEYPGTSHSQFINSSSSNATTFSVSSANGVPFSSHFTSVGDSMQSDHIVPVYSEIGPVIKSDPIVPISKPSVLRVPNKNGSIILSAIQSIANVTQSNELVMGSSVSTNTVWSSSSSGQSMQHKEALDNERQRLLRQQQMQKLKMATQCNENSTRLSLDKFSKQMKEVGPNVVVEINSSALPETGLPNGKSCSSVSNNHWSRGNTISTFAVASSEKSGYLSSAISPSELDLKNGGVPRLLTNPMGLVNRQQVREGLRQLVNSRSAAGNKNIAAAGASNRHPLSSSQNVANPDIGIASVSNVAVSVVTTSSTNTASSRQLPPVAPPPYPTDLLAISSNSQFHGKNANPIVSNVNNNNSTSTGQYSDPNKNTSLNILDDSLINDVFGLEELVHNKTMHGSRESSVHDTGASITTNYKNEESHSLMSPVLSTNINSNSNHQKQSNLQPHHHHVHHHHHHVYNGHHHHDYGHHYHVHHHGNNNKNSNVHHHHHVNNTISVSSSVTSVTQSANSIQSASVMSLPVSSTLSPSSSTISFTKGGGSVSTATLASPNYSAPVSSVSAASTFSSSSVAIAAPSNTNTSTPTNNSCLLETLLSH